MTPNKYPLGIQTFEKVRVENRLYLDKTEYVYRMTHGTSSYVFLSRPRRFGKSLLVSFDSEKGNIADWMIQDC